MASGGGTKNDILMKMVADITGEAVHITKVTIGASYGDALMAGIGTGLFDGFEDLQRVIRFSAAIKPDLERHTAYQRYRRIYDQAYLANRELMHSL